MINFFRMILSSVTEAEPKDKLYNFIKLTGESVSSSWDRFTTFIRSVMNHCIYDKSLKEYLYQGQDENNKEMLDTIVRGLYGECTFL